MKRLDTIEWILRAYDMAKIGVAHRGIARHMFAEDIDTIIKLSKERKHMAEGYCSSQKYHEKLEENEAHAEALEKKIDTIAQKYGMTYYSSDGGITMRLKPHHVDDNDIGGMLYIPQF